MGKEIEWLGDIDKLMTERDGKKVFRHDDPGMERAQAFFQEMSSDEPGVPFYTLYSVVHCGGD